MAPWRPQPTRSSSPCPTGSRWSSRRARRGADAAAAIGPGPGQGGAGDQGRRRAARPRRAAARGGAPRWRSSPTATPRALELIRHDAAHVMAEAVTELYPGTKVTIGPPIESGFYYDFEFPDRYKDHRGGPAEDRGGDARAHRRRRAVRPPRRHASPRRSRSSARQDQGFKVELIEDLVRDEGVETVSLYRNGPFEDLCRGPHAPSTGRIKAIKLSSVAGAYWRGDENREQLTRIYGTAFFSKKDLEEHLERIERGRRRATTAGSAPSSASSCCATRRRGCRSGCPTGPRCCA